MCTDLFVWVPRFRWLAGDPFPSGGFSIAMVQPTTEEKKGRSMLSLTGG